MKVGSVEVGPPAPQGESRARRFVDTADRLVDRPTSDTGIEINVMHDVLRHSVKKFSHQKAMGWRDTIKVHNEEKEITKVIGGKEVKEKKTWTYFELSDYKWWTYQQFYDIVLEAGSALVKTGHSKETIFNIYASTSPKWQVMANACAAQGVTFATAYDSLGEEGLRHSINEPKVYGMFSNANLLGMIAAVVKDTPSLKVLIYDGKQEDVKAGALDKLKQAGVEVHHFDDFIKLGKDNRIDANPGTPEDTMCIMYTSGSTGTPKGVVISNANVVACIGSVQALLPHVVCEGETYIAYLPLAHILEMAVEQCFLFVGAQIGYGTVKTLTDASVRNCPGDIRALAPTVMVGVPAVWELIRKGILSKVKAGGAFKERIFNFALAAKQWGGRGSFTAGLMDKIVFNTLKQGLGGSMCCLLPPEYFRYGSVGVPVPSVELKLVDVPEAGYFTSNKIPEGEVWIRGPSVMKGYYQRDDLTKETMKDGWLNTGDIARINEDGTVSLIDRKKNLVKLSGGEYIALERLESVFKSCSVVSNICVHGDSNANKPMAIIFPHEANLKQFVKDQNLAPGKEDDLHALCHDDKVREAVVKQVNDTGKRAGFKALEMLQTVILDPEEWLPSNGMTTAAQKLNRKAILEKHKDEMNKVYP
ncbi:long-chain fatty acid-CoA ligase [Microbotryomycetes sp. JL221]|nr:long-chain fatty acid-CoA ligase [Microbotryomycetes sp. JL221]